VASPPPLPPPTEEVVFGLDALVTDEEDVAVRPEEVAETDEELMVPLPPPTLPPKAVENRVARRPTMEPLLLASFSSGAPDGLLAANSAVGDVSEPARPVDL